MVRRDGKKGWAFVVFVGLALFLLTGKPVYALGLKPGAVRAGRREMEYAEQVVAGVWHEYGRMAVVTSGTDSHTGGLHPMGLAEDFRTNDIEDTAEKHEMISKVRAVLELAGYQLFFEDEGRPNEHLHIEYDPH